MFRRIAQSPESASPRNSLRRPFTFLPRRVRMIGVIAHRVVFGFLKNEGMSYSAAMAFWLVLSLPPLVIAVSSVASVLLPHDSPRQILAEQIVAQLPAEGGLIRDLVEREVGLLSVGGAFSLIFLFFSGSRVFAAVVRAIDVMWRHVEEMGVVRRELMRFALVIIVGGMLVGSILLQVSLVAFQEDLGMGVGVLVGWLLPFALVVIGLFVTYKLLPRRRATWKTALLGAVIAAVSLRLAQVVFVFLLGTFLEFEEGYGPLAEVALLATWAFVASAIILLGAQLVATLDRHRLPHVPLPSSAQGDPVTSED
jgi:membrane protein